MSVSLNIHFPPTDEEKDTLASQVTPGSDSPQTKRAKFVCVPVPSQRDQGPPQGCAPSLPTFHLAPACTSSLPNLEVQDEGSLPVTSQSWLPREPRQTRR